MYKLLNDLRNGQPYGAIYLEKNTSFLFNENNPDYQAYLAWLAEGNTVLPPDEPVNA